MGTFDTTALPAHARLIANGDVWMEGDGVAQLAKAAGLPGCVAAAGMPDLHVGKGPVGAVLATRGKVYPHLLGGDVGCGVSVFATSEDAKNRDAVERRVRKGWEEDPLDGCDPRELLGAVWRRGVAGLAEVESASDTIRALALAMGEIEAEGRGAGAPGGDGLDGTGTGGAGAPGDDGLDGTGTGGAGEEGDPGEATELGGGFEAALGTIGGGNHFVEIGRVDEVRDAEAAARLGLARGALVVIAHSGSRGLGAALARRWGDATLEDEGAVREYLRHVAGARRFAQVNRFLLGYKMLRALGAARRSKIAGAFEVTHNDVRREPVEGAPAWVHRKGAAPAYEGSATIVLGSRGAPSWVLRGTGSERGLRSVAHGAGRRMGRAEALAKLKGKYRRSELGTTRLGGRVVCDDADLLYEEHPDAYKPIEPVVASLIDAGLATPVASLVPVVTVKR